MTDGMSRGRCHCSSLSARHRTVQTPAATAARPSTAAAAPMVAPQRSHRHCFQHTLAHQSLCSHDSFCQARAASQRTAAFSRTAASQLTCQRTLTGKRTWSTTLSWRPMSAQRQKQHSTTGSMAQANGCCAGGCVSSFVSLVRIFAAHTVTINCDAC